MQKTEVVTSKLSKWVKLQEAATKIEYCQNPWNPNCESTDVELYIVYEGMKIPICRSCWQEIAETDLEWQMTKTENHK